VTNNFSLASGVFGGKNSRLRLMRELIAGRAPSV